MDLESELRKAMAEHVAGTTAAPSLAADVRRRHRRRRARVHAAAGAAAAAVAVLALVPAYRSLQTAPAGSAGAHGPAPGVPASPRPERPPAPDLPGTSPSKGSPGTGTGTGRGPDAHPSPGTAGEPREPGAGGAVARPPRWITYIPDGLAPTGPCAVTEQTGRRTTTCTWHGGAGRLEIALVTGAGLTGPQDLMKAPGVPGRTSVRGMPALTGDRPDSSRQISWLARPGVGVTVTGRGAVKDDLVRVAEGVRP